MNGFKHGILKEKNVYFPKSNLQLEAISATECIVNIYFTTFQKRNIFRRRRSKLNGSSSLQVVLDLLGVLAVESLQFLVELHVPLVDVIWKEDIPLVNLQRHGAL